MINIENRTMIIMENNSHFSIDMDTILYISRLKTKISSYIYEVFDKNSKTTIISYDPSLIEEFSKHMSLIRGSPPNNPVDFYINSNNFYALIIPTDEFKKKDHLGSNNLKTKLFLTNGLTSYSTELFIEANYLIDLLKQNENLDILFFESSEFAITIDTKKMTHYKIHSPKSTEINFKGAENMPIYYTVSNSRYDSFDMILKQHDKKKIIISDL